MILSIFLHIIDGILIDIYAFNICLFFYCCIRILQPLRRMLGNTTDHPIIKSICVQRIHIFQNTHLIKVDRRAPVPFTHIQITHFIMICQQQIMLPDSKHPKNTIATGIFIDNLRTASILCYTIHPLTNHDIEMLIIIIKLGIHVIIEGIFIFKFVKLLIRSIRGKTIYDVISTFL